MTSFQTIIDCFLGKITDDMYLELTPEDTIRDATQFLLDAIPYFEFPRFALYDYNVDSGYYNCDLTVEEINILALLMKAAWLNRQINSIENTRMKYSGADFKLTSQANHLAKLLQLKNENLKESTHAQRLYKRRKLTSSGMYQSNWGWGAQSALDESTDKLNDVATSTTTGNQSGSQETEGDYAIWVPILPEDEEEDYLKWEKIQP